MADWVGTVKDLPIVKAQFSGAGFFTARMWPQTAGDQTPPVVSIVSPTPGTNISGVTPLVFDVTDTGLFRRIIVRLKFTGQNWEFIHDGDTFGPGYQADSTRTIISGGYRYSLRKDGGWPIGQVPRLTVYAIDTGGNEAP